MLTSATLKALLSLLWSLKFWILLGLFFLLSSYHIQKTNNMREEFEDTLNKIEVENLNQKLILTEKVRTLEQNINEELKVNSEIKKEKDIEIDNLNGTISDNSSRLQQLAKQAIESDKYQCTDTVTTKVVERIVEVPTPGKPSGVTTEVSGEIPKIIVETQIPKESNSQIILEMASDFEDLSATCSNNYEKLKNEAVELESWADTIVNNTEIE